MAQQKITDAKIAFARQVIAARREAERQLRMYPTTPELAAELGVSARYLQKLIAGKARAR